MPAAANANVSCTVKLSNSISCTKEDGVGRANAGSIATRYGTDRPGDRIPLRTRFSTLVQTDRRARPASCTMGTGLFPGLRRPERRVSHPPPSSAEVKERVELYIYSYLGLHGKLYGEIYLHFTEEDGKTSSLFGPDYLIHQSHYPWGRK
jgi:hypothetical protein